MQHIERNAVPLPVLAGDTAHVPARRAAALRSKRQGHEYTNAPNYFDTVRFPQTTYLRKACKILIYSLTTTNRGAVQLHQAVTEPEQQAHAGPCLPYAAFA
jgi:hypothetical protein